MQCLATAKRSLASPASCLQNIFLRLKTVIDSVGSSKNKKKDCSA